MRKLAKGLFIAMIMVFIVMVFVNAETVHNNNVIEGVYYGYGNTADTLLKEWIKSCGDEKAINNMIDENGFYRGCGIVLADQFEHEYMIDFSFENMKKYLKRILKALKWT